MYPTLPMLCYALVLPQPAQSLAYCGVHHHHRHHHHSSQPLHTVSYIVGEHLPFESVVLQPLLTTIYLSPSKAPGIPRPSPVALAHLPPFRFTHVPCSPVSKPFPSLAISTQSRLRPGPLRQTVKSRTQSPQTRSRVGISATQYLCGNSKRVVSPRRCSRHHRRLTSIHPSMPEVN